MDYACPHCRELTRTDPVTGLPPAMCPRCGGDIDVDMGRAQAPATPASAAVTAPAARSLATFLQPAVPADEYAADSPRADATEPADVLTSPIPAAHATGPALDAGPACDTGDGGHARGESHIGEAGANPESATVAAPDSTDSTDSTDTMQQATSSASGPSAAGDPVAATASTAAQPEAALPSFSTPPRNPLPSRTMRWQWLALATLSLLLVVQILLADRARLAADPQWRPLLVSLCGVFGCSLPPWREPDAFTMLSRDVRPVPGAARALQVQATFRNDARWSQAWPVMRVSLSDADGRVVGSRAFAPSEYLEEAATQTALAPGQSAQVMLQVREPGAGVVAFSFDFD